MVQVASLFNQLLHHFPRLEFGALVKKHKAERAAKGFDCWSHADSLREICNGLSCCLGQAGALGHQPGSLEVDLVLRQRTSSRRALPGTVLYGPVALPRPARPGRSQAYLPLQEQAPLAGLHDHLPLLIALPLGEVPSRQGRGQSACAAGPRRLSASLRAAHARPRQ